MSKEGFRWILISSLQYSNDKEDKDILENAEVYIFGPKRRGDLETWKIFVQLKLKTF